MELGQYIKEKRLEKDMSQRELAIASGLSNAEISRIEAGKRKEPSNTVLKAIANALNTPLQDMLAETGIIEKGKQATNKALQTIGNESFDSQIIKKYLSYNKSNLLNVEDLTDDEIEDVKKYIAFIKSKRNS